MENVSQEGMNTLIQSIEGGQAVLWLGAGFSKMFGFPLWSELENYLEEAGELSKTAINVSNTADLLERGKNVLDFLSLNWKYIVTTNHDLTLLTLIQAIRFRAGSQSGEQGDGFKPFYPMTYENDEHLENQDFFRPIYPKIRSLIYLHGTILSPSSLINTRKKISEKISDKLAKFHDPLLTTNNQTCLFIGTSLTRYEPHVTFLKKLARSENHDNFNLYQLGETALEMKKPTKANKHFKDLPIKRIPLNYLSKDGYVLYENFYKIVFNCCKSKNKYQYKLHNDNRNDADEIKFKRTEFSDHDNGVPEFYSMFDVANTLLNPMSPLNKTVIIVDFDSASRLLRKRLEFYKKNLCSQGNNNIYKCFNLSNNNLDKNHDEFTNTLKNYYAVYALKSLHWIVNTDNIDLPNMMKGNILISGIAENTSIDTCIKKWENHKKKLEVIRLRIDYKTHCKEVLDMTKTLWKTYPNIVQELSNNREDQRKVYDYINDIEGSKSYPLYYSDGIKLEKKSQKILLALALYVSILDEQPDSGKPDDGISIDRFNDSVYEWVIASLLYHEKFSLSDEPKKNKKKAISDIYTKVPESLRRAFLFCLERFFYVLMDEQNKKKSKLFLENLKRIEENENKDMKSIMATYQRVLTLYYDASIQLYNSDYQAKTKFLYFKWLDSNPKHTTNEDEQDPINPKRPKPFYRAFDKELQKKILEVLKKETHPLHKYIFGHLYHTNPKKIIPDIKKRIKELRNIYEKCNDPENKRTLQYLDLLIKEWQLDTRNE